MKSLQTRAGWRFRMWGLLLVGLGCVAVGLADPMMTRWGRELDTERPWDEYPRPQLVRQAWENLNGHWDYAVTTDGDPPPVEFIGKIVVPFPIESVLSGVGRRLEASEVLWYQRRFTVPEDWKGQRVKLHFGAVDWETRVWVNGMEVGSHRGGYDAFSFDITEALGWQGSNELRVAVQDPTEGDQPRGKQAQRPEGIFYMPTSGIWQTVWLEPVPQGGIQEIYLDPDLAGGTLQLRAMVDVELADSTVEVRATLEGVEVGRGTTRAGALLNLPLSVVRAWSPDDPVLYDLEVSIQQQGRTADRVASYFALREIRVAKDDDGRPQLFLNGEAVFQMGVLDQGFWPDGLYTAPSPEALKYDLEMVKELGFNLVRKHVKVEPALWYYWADHLGLLVWQDMPSGNNASAEGRGQFELELQRMIRQLGNHPSIIMWVLFNEGWGQFDTERLVRRLKAVDPTRLVNNASGWTDAKVGDVLDLHSYPHPIAPAAESSRATVLGEFGGLALAVEGHKWSDQTWGYQGVENAESLTRQYCEMIQNVWFRHQHQGLAAAIYTQLTDVETEVNGFLSYDREVLKVELDPVRQVNQGRLQGLVNEMLLPDAQQGSFLWRFTTYPPDSDWMKPGYVDSDWRTGPGGFGTPGTPGVFINTEWDTRDIWLRRQFRLPDPVPEEVSLIIHHDDEAKVWLNGVLVAELEGFTTGYTVVQLSGEARTALVPGANLLAIHGHQENGGQYIDAGLRGKSGGQ